MKKDFDKIKKDVNKIWKGGKFDPNGSYVGTAEDFERPVQDADDL